VKKKKDGGRESDLTFLNILLFCCFIVMCCFGVFSPHFIMPCRGIANSYNSKKNGGVGFEFEFEVEFESDLQNS